MPETPIGVLIADDHAVVRDGLSVLISSLSDIDVVGLAASGEEAVRAAIELGPDVVLMDLSMPEMSGIEATVRICRAVPTTRVLVLTTHEDAASLAGALGAGASGYLLKTSGIGEIATAIRAVHSGQLTFGSDITATALRLLRADPKPRPFPDLTEREREVLDLLAGGLSTTDIASALRLSGKTVSNYLSTIFVKLRVATRTEAALLAREAGMGLKRR